MLLVQTQVELTETEIRSAGVPDSAGPAFVMVSCDIDFLAAAIAEGIAVQDPRNHP